MTSYYSIVMTTVLGQADTDNIFYYIMILFKQFYSLKHDPPVKQIE
jgi:hypothetical protein